MFKGNAGNIGLVSSAAGLAVLLSGFMFVISKFLEANPSSLHTVFILLLLGMAAAGIILVSLSEAYTGMLEEVAWQFSAIVFGERLLEGERSEGFIQGPPIKALLNLSSLPLLATVALTALLGFENLIWLMVLLLGVIFTSTLILLRLAEAAEDHKRFLESLETSRATLSLLRLLESRAARDFRKLLLAKLILTSTVIGILMLKISGLSFPSLAASSLTFLASASFLSHLFFKIGTRNGLLKLKVKMVEEAQKLAFTPATSGAAEQPEKTGEKAEEIGEEKEETGSEGKEEAPQKAGKKMDEREVKPEAETGGAGETEVKEVKPEKVEEASPKPGEVEEKPRQEASKPSLEEAGRVEVKPSSVKAAGEVELTAEEEKASRELTEFLRLIDELRVEIRKLKERSVK
ncbi:MAG: hypothetical protein DRO46_00905 [Candidatus Hecatellales archaeon]|nr:MAG: hypothetical protein DRO46_00905 [Candidatus Hecatellales archaeon]